MIIFEHTLSTVLIWSGLGLALLLCILSHLKWVTFNLYTLAILLVRMLFFAVLAWCLFLPGTRTAETTILNPRFVIALDTSSSMLLTPDEAAPKRWDAALEALQMPWVEFVNAECDIDLYPLAAEVGAQRTLEEASRLMPDGEATRLRDNLVQITSRYTGQNVAGMLVLSDGLDTREADDEWTSMSWPFPLYTVRLEPEALWEKEPDLRIDSVHTPRRVTVGWNTELKAVISGEGVGGQAHVVELFRNGLKIDEVPLQIPVGGGSREATFELQNPQEGAFTYRVHVPPVEGESNTDDNEYEISVLVVVAENRLLYVEGLPRWESKYLSRTLRANEQIESLGFIKGPGGQFMHFGTRGSMTTALRKDQLAFFKIVILGNLRASELAPEQVNNLVDFVRTGGSLILLGGAQGWGPDGFIKTDLRTILPVKSWATELREGRFPVELTDAGRSHPAFAATDPGLWDILPPVLSVFPGATLSLAAQSLVTAETPQGREILIATHRYGQGKVAVTLTDSLWKWVLNEATLDAQPYERFWNQLLAWAMPEKEEIDTRPLDLWADREQLSLGEELRIKARKTAKQDAPAPGAPVTCEITTADDRTLSFTMTPEQVVTPSGKAFPGFAATFTAEEPGLHRITAVMEADGQRITSDPVSFFVKPYTPESVPRAANTEVLQRLAGNSGGAYFPDLRQLNDALAALNFASTEQEQLEYKSLWENWLTIGLLIGLLGLEWLLRKLRNMP